MNLLLCKTVSSDSDNQKFADTGGTAKYSCYSLVLKNTSLEINEHIIVSKYSGKWIYEKFSI
jgi:hypothetical protein